MKMNAKKCGLEVREVSLVILNLLLIKLKQFSLALIPVRALSPLETVAVCLLPCLTG